MAVASPPFSGFSPEAIQFLADLAANNDRAWFQPRKADYERLLKEPLEALVAALAERFEARGDPAPGRPEAFDLPDLPRHPLQQGQVAVQDATSGRASRGSRRTAVAAHEGAHANGGYFHFQPGEMYAGGGMWHDGEAPLDAFRTAVRRRSGSRAGGPRGARLRRRRSATVRTHEELKRVPPGLPGGPPAGRLCSAGRTSCSGGGWPTTRSSRRTSPTRSPTATRRRCRCSASSRRSAARLAPFSASTPAATGTGSVAGGSAAARSAASTAITAAPMIPASLRSCAGTTGGRTVSRGPYLSKFLLTPPPRMNSSGQISSSMRIKCSSRSCVHAFHDRPRLVRATDAERRSAGRPRISIWPNSVFGTSLPSMNTADPTPVPSVRSTTTPGLPAADPEAHLGGPGCIRVVDDRDRSLQRPAQALCDRELDPRRVDVRGGLEDATEHDAWHPQAEWDIWADPGCVHEPLDEPTDRGAHGVRRRWRRRRDAQALRDEATVVGVDDRGLDPAAPDIDPDCDPWLSHRSAS